jgi:uncharacterized protein DUF3710
VEVFRRRREDADRSGQEPAGAAGTREEPEAGGGAAGQEPGQRSSGPAGPWDAGEDVPAQERIDFGSLLVPMGEGCDVQVSVIEDQAAWVTVVRGESGLQLQAFAAPKSGGLWDEVRQEIADEVARTGGECTEADGPFGVELRARITPAEPVQGARRGALEPVRFLGVDGPRWFLRGLISGPAARREELARPLEQVFADVVVVRGDHPVPPRDLLEIQLPEQARQALAAQAPEPDEGGWPLNPFERGPEITETR